MSNTNAELWDRIVELDKRLKALEAQEGTQGADGHYLPLAGGTMDPNAVVTMPGASTLEADVVYGHRVVGGNIGIQGGTPFTIPLAASDGLLNLNWMRFDVATWNAKKLQGTYIDATTPTLGQIAIIRPSMIGAGGIEIAWIDAAALPALAGYLALAGGTMTGLLNAFAGLKVKIDPATGRSFRHLRSDGVPLVSLDDDGKWYGDARGYLDFADPVQFRSAILFALADLAADGNFAFWTHSANYNRTTGQFDRNNGDHPVPQLALKFTTTGAEIQFNFAPVEPGSSTATMATRGRVTEAGDLSMDGFGSFATGVYGYSVYSDAARMENDGTITNDNATMAPNGQISGSGVFANNPTPGSQLFRGDNGEETVFAVDQEGRIYNNLIDLRADGWARCIKISTMSGNEWYLETGNNGAGAPPTPNSTVQVTIDGVTYLIPAFLA